MTEDDAALGDEDDTSGAFEEFVAEVYTALDDLSQRMAAIEARLTPKNPHPDQIARS